MGLVLLNPANELSARKRTLSEMRSAVASISQMPNGMRRLAPASSSRFNVVKEESQLSVLSDGTRFAVIANDDDFDAVLAYADTPFDEKALSNPGLAWWMEAMNESLARHAQEGTRPHKVSVNPKYKQNVDPLLTTLWSQEEPFFNMTPTYVNGTKEVHFVTGCVATAMSQIMKYYNYPETGSGSKSYRCNMYASDGDPITKRISVNFAATTYDWKNMLDKYGKTYTPESGNAVATLMYHCGVSVMMDYDKTGSGSYTFRAIDALKTNFRYNQNMQFYLRDYYHVDEWMDIVFSHLSSGHPILFGAQAKSGGHEFVIDGYGSTGLVHVNWGWGGSSNGMFEMASLNGYSSAQDMVPVFLPEVMAECHSSFGFNSDPRISVALGGLSFSADRVLNTDYRDFTGSIAVIAASLSDGSERVLASKYDEVKGYGYNLQLHHAQLSFSKIDLTNLPDGSYRIYAASSREDESKWQPIRSKEGVSNSAILTKEGGKLSLVKEASSNWVVGVNGIMPDAIASPIGVYTLSGQKVSDASTRSLPRGIYVKDGRKIVK